MGQKTHKHAALPEAGKSPRLVHATETAVDLAKGVKAFAQTPPIAVPTLAKGLVDVVRTPTGPHLGQAVVEILIDLLDIILVGPYPCYACSERLLSVEGEMWWDTEWDYLAARKVHQLGGDCHQWRDDTRAGREVDLGPGAPWVEVNRIRPMSRDD